MSIVTDGYVRTVAKVEHKHGIDRSHARLFIVSRQPPRLILPPDYPFTWKITALAVCLVLTVAWIAFLGWLLWLLHAAGMWAVHAVVQAVGAGVWLRLLGGAGPGMQP